MVWCRLKGFQGHVAKFLTFITSFSILFFCFYVAASLLLIAFLFSLVE